MPDEPIKRLRYFTGQFLEAGDFAAEQSYHVRLRRRRNSTLYFPGVLDGGFSLKNLQNEKKIEISPGIGVDAQGRELIIANPLTESPPGAGNYFVTLSYQEKEADIQTQTGDGAVSDSTRYDETPKVSFFKDGTSFDKDIFIVIAKITVDNAGAITGIDPSVRQHAHGRFPGDLTVGQGGNEVLHTRHIDGKDWRNDNKDHLYLNWNTGTDVYLGFGDNTKASLSVSGNVGIGTLQPAGKLDIQGDIRAGNSDIYFTKTDHAHSGIGNTTGYATIENASDFDALMILGRAGTDKGRKVRLWDFWEVNGPLAVQRNLVIGSGKTISSSGRLHISGEENLYLLNKGGVIVSKAWGGNGNLLVEGDIAISGKHAFRGNDPWLRLNQDGAFPSGVHTPGVFAPMSLNVGGKNSWGNPGAGNAWFTGSIAVDGDIAVAGKHALRGNDPWLRLNQDEAFSSGVHTPGIFAPGSLNVGGMRGWGNPGAGNVWVAGNVGIGTTDVREKLHVAGAFIRVDGAGNEQAYIGGDGSGGDVQIGSFNSNVRKVSFWDTSNGWMDIEYRNNIGHSDKRDKKNITHISGALACVMKLRGVFFDWKDDSSNNEGKKNVGFIAQEVDRILPEAVFRSSRGTYGINYSSLLPVVIEAIKEQQKEIDEIKIMIARKVPKSERSGENRKY